MDTSRRYPKDSVDVTFAIEDFVQALVDQRPQDEIEPLRTELARTLRSWSKR